MIELSDILKDFQQPTPKYGRFALDKSEAKKFSEDLRNSVYESFNSQKFKIYGRVVQGTEGQARNFFQISLINDFMIAEDNKFIECMNKLGDSDDINILTGEEQDVIRKYHPYSWEFFTGRITSGEDSKFLRELDEKWVEVKLFKSPPDNATKNENSIIVKGTLYFSASPSIEIDGALVVTDKKAEKDIPTDKMWQNIKNYTNVETFEKVKRAWVHDSELVRQPEITVLNVGQGNCIAINMPNKMRIFFDVGLSIYKHDFEEKYILAAKAYLSQSMPNWIILSHWDMDHIKGYYCIELSKEYDVNSKCYVMAPNPNLLIKKPSDMAIRLSYYRIENHTIWLIDNRNSKENCVIKSNFNSIWQGFIESKIASKVANNIGLIWQIFIDDKVLLFTGDCEYKYMPKALKNCSYDLLIVPHHCSGSSKTHVEINGNQNSRAIISVGRNPYGHPGIEHIQELKERNFQVSSTIGTYGIRFNFQLNVMCQELKNKDSLKI